MAGSRSSSKRRHKSKKKYEDHDSASSSSTSLSDSSTESEIDEKRHRRHRRDHRRSGRSSRRRRDEKSREKLMDGDIKSKQRRDSKSNSQCSFDDNLELDPEAVVSELLQEYPSMASDLHQLLQMLDDGQAVDIRGMSEKSLITHLRKLFLALNLKRNKDGVFLLPSNTSPTLEIVGKIVTSRIAPKENIHIDHTPIQGTPEVMVMPCPKDQSVAPRRRTIGPEMPSAELLAAAAKLTEAEAELRDAQVNEDDVLFVGPPPPAVVSEAASTNEAERFEEVTRIMGLEAGTPYDVLAVNHKMTEANVKKRYWKLSLMIHPDKCPHPQASQAFIILNKAFKEFQDPEKRKALDDKIKLKEQEAAFKIELRAMREAAQWRKLQGISMEGDDVLLAESNNGEPPKRDEWMTTLPPERKPGGMPKQSTKFNNSSKEGRGDTSNWTDTPSDRAQKAKINYLEAYNEARTLASNEVEKTMDADLVDKYNKAKRSQSLLEKTREEAASKLKSKKKKKKKTEKEEWTGQHPWKPWDREKDLTAGRKSVNLDSENMSQGGLTSRFSSANFQRNFL